MSDGVRYVRAAGDHVTIGRRHGQALAAELREFVADGLCRLHHVMPTPVPLDSLRATIEAYRRVVTAHLPGLADEVQGLADGAGLSLDEAWLLQLRREVMGYLKVGAAAECTTYARAGAAGGAGGGVLAQTIDLNGNLDDQLTVLDVAPTGGRGRALVLSFAGLVGYLGVNSAGLAVGLNLVLGGDWRPGVPPYLAIRHLLDTASSVDQAIALLRGLPLASSRSFTLCDSTKAAWVEVLGDQLRVTEAGQTVHTNHFLDPDLVPYDEINVFSRNSSVRRLESCVDRLAALPEQAPAEDHFGVLSAPPICVPDDGDIRRERTVAAVVMLPERGELHLRPGDPSRSRTQVFGLSQVGASW
ncbi:MAG: C45 family autoproteolytic acyltransferase/hydrolase [Micromonosporaceae bacterium]